MGVERGQGKTQDGRPAAARGTRQARDPGVKVVQDEGI
jgi:hypothetical protein